MFDYLHERLDSLESKWGRRTKNKTYAFMNCIIQVNSRKSGWQKAVLCLMKAKHGVGSFQMNEEGMVRISGIADPNELLKCLEKKGRRAKLIWFQYGQCSDYLFGPSLLSMPPLTHSYYDRPRFSYPEEEDEETWPPLRGEGHCCTLM